MYAILIILDDGHSHDLLARGWYTIALEDAPTACFCPRLQMLPLVHRDYSTYLDFVS